MTAAIFAARNGASTAIIEGNDTLGKKILATGNGKCNFTNEVTDESCYYGAPFSFVETVRKRFSEKDAVRFFETLGVVAYAKNGYYYPRTQQASTISEALQSELRRLGTDVFLQTRVRGIQREKDCFMVKGNEESFYAKKVILALGGRASKIKGSNGDGYYYAQQLGHTVTPLVPALVSLHTDNPYIKKMAGVRCEAKVSVLVEDEPIRSEFGELQLTADGISGIVVFQLSRIAAMALQENKRIEAVIDFVPELSEKRLRQWLELRLQMTKEEPPASSLIGVVHEKIIAGLLEANSITKRKDFDSTKRIDSLISDLKAFRISITDTNGFQNAQITAGGIAATDIHPTTMESKVVPGLFFAGEIVDVDGICGGYNLQWAWASGAVAGYHAARGSQETEGALLISQEACC